MDIEKKIMDKILLMSGASPELKGGLAALGCDAFKQDDLSFLYAPVLVFHEGARFDTSCLNTEEYEEFEEFMPNGVVVDGEGYVDNIEYLTPESAYKLMKRFGILSLVARALEAKEVAWDRLWELAKKHPEAPFEMQEAVVLRGNRAILEWDAGVLESGVLSWHLEGQEVTCGLSPEKTKEIFDDWGVTALVKELIGD